MWTHCDRYKEFSISLAKICKRFSTKGIGGLDIFITPSYSFIIFEKHPLRIWVVCPVVMVADAFVFRFLKSKMQPPSPSPLCVQMNFTRTFKTTTMCNSINHVWSLFYETLVVLKYHRQGWGTLCFPEHFTVWKPFAFLPFAQKNSLLQIGLLQFAS